MGSEQESAIDEFIGITGIAKSVAEQYLARNDYDVELAVNDYYNNENITSVSKQEFETKKKETKKQVSNRSSGSIFRSFSDLQGGSQNEDDNDDDMNFFTGGQKSGLAVEDPLKSGNNRKLVDDLIEKAQNEAGQPDWRDNNSDDEKKVNKEEFFKGTGHSLGSVENSVESKKVPGSDQRLKYSSKPEKVTRTITFWKEGFSVDEGELYKYDDPQNQEYLKQLNMGRAPLSLLNVQMFQDVDVNVVKKLEESYHDHQKSKPRVFGFQGSGNRLGSPVPGEPLTVDEALEKYNVDAKENNSITSEIKPAVKDIQEEVRGDTSIQIRLANGERIIQRFNSTDLIEEIYKFVESKCDDITKKWGLVTSFPTQPLDDKKDQTIAASGLKNAVVIQRWA